MFVIFNYTCFKNFLVALFQELLEQKINIPKEAKGLFVHNHGEVVFMQFFCMNSHLGTSSKHVSCTSHGYAQVFGLMEKILTNDHL